MNLTRYDSTALAQMESRDRAALINSISGFKSASLIGTIDNNQHTNLAVFSSVVHLGSDPALIGFINRPDSTSRHTLENILETKSFTINHIHRDFYQKAHQTAARYPKETSEFDAVGLTAEFGQLLPAPYVKEANIKYGLEFAEKHELKINGTLLIIGKIVEIILPENCLLAHGGLDIEKAGTVALSGLDGYHSTQLLDRLSYAKPGTLPLSIT